MKIKILPHHGIVGGEVRPLYFYKAFGLEIAPARIISFGQCNFSCPYCKRDGAFRNSDGTIQKSVEITEKELAEVIASANLAGEVIRLSGGDPVSFPKASLWVASLANRLSVAHNGSSPEFISQLMTAADGRLESAAIDLKAPHSLMGLRTGLSSEMGERMYKRTLETQDFLSNSGVLVDIRTPVFGDTTLDDMLELASDIIRGGNSNYEFWTWRLYKPVRGCDWKAPETESILWMIDSVKKAYPQIKIGLRAKWEPEGFLYF